MTPTNVATHVAPVSTATAKTANASLKNFFAASLTMPTGGTPDTLSKAKMAEFLITIPTDRVSELNDDQLLKLINECAQMNAIEIDSEIVAIDKTKVKVWGSDGTDTGTEQDACLVKLICSVQNGSDIKNVKLNYVLRSKNSTNDFLDTFVVGNVGKLQFTATKINLPVAWVRVI